MAAFVGSLARASFFHHRNWTKSFHTLIFPKKCNTNLQVLFPGVQSVKIWSQIRQTSSLTALFRRKKAVKSGAEAAGSSIVPIGADDSLEHLKVSVSSGCGTILWRSVNADYGVHIQMMHAFWRGSSESVRL